MELPEDINDDDDEMSVGDDEATSESAIAEFHAPSSGSNQPYCTNHEI